ncbi:MAG: hypothetical protein WCU88_01410 [Elusimicrobiota bacterium]|jgi:acid phosphatase class B
MAIVKAARERVDKTVSLFKQLVGMMMVWGLVFSLVTIGSLKVAFDYDDTLVFSTPAYAKAFRSGVQPFSPAFWEIINNSYDIEGRKILANSLAWGLRIFGFKITILADRPSSGGQALRKEWRHLCSNFVFAGDGEAARRGALQNGTYVLYFTDRDSSIIEARKARILPVRIRRSSKSTYREEYHPGTLHELVIPGSEY